MVATWRAHWGDLGADFAWASTQLGDQGFNGVSEVWPAYVGTPRDAQQVITAGRYPGVSRTARAGLIAAYDRGDRVGNPYGSGDVHSRFKGELGRRMALLVANLTGEAGAAPAWDGPHASVVAQHAADGSLSLVWGPGDAGAVYMSGTQDCWECCDGSRALDTFQLSPTLAGPNGTHFQAWTNASWSFDGVRTVTRTPQRHLRPGGPGSSCGMQRRCGPSAPGIAL